MSVNEGEELEEDDEEEDKEEFKVDLENLNEEDEA